MSKGSRARPLGVTQEEFADRWAETFARRPQKFTGDMRELARRLQVAAGGGQASTPGLLAADPPAETP